MNRAEERAKERYRVEPCKPLDINTQNRYYAYIVGYHQAEKELELTWEDIELIVNIEQDTNNEESIIGVRKNEEHYQEVLKRFKVFKGK